MDGKRLVHFQSETSVFKFLSWTERWSPKRTLCRGPGGGGTPCNLERLPLWPNSTDVDGVGAEFERTYNVKVQV